MSLPDVTKETYTSWQEAKTFSRGCKRGSKKKGDKREIKNKRHPCASDFFSNKKTNPTEKEDNRYPFKIPIQSNKDVKSGAESPRGALTDNGSYQNKGRIHRLALNEPYFLYKQRLLLSVTR